MKTKFIFDLDGTLLNGDFSKEEEYFKSELTSRDSAIFIPKIVDLLEKYENKFKKYDINVLAEFLTYESHVNITPNIIKGWIDINQTMDDEIIDGVVEILEELKMRDKDLVVLTNWFSQTQAGRLKKSNLDIYFDEVIGGETWLKPNKDAYMVACGETPIELCVMIGDNYKKDYLGAKRIGIESVLYDPNGKRKENKDSVKSLIKLKEKY